MKQTDAVISATSAETSTCMFSDEIKTTKCAAKQQPIFGPHPDPSKPRSRSKEEITGRPYFLF